MPIAAMPTSPSAGGTITAIGNVPASPQADEIDGSGFIVLPGFVDIHAHPSSEPMLKGLTDEVGSRQLYMSSLYEYLPLFENDDEGRRASNEVALCELLQSGVTTVCDLSSERDGWLDTLGESGIRAYAAPGFRSGRWYTTNGHEVRYEWNEKAGSDGLDGALRLIDRARQHPSGRLSGMVYPAQVDTCTEELLRDAAAAARERGLPLQIHAAQSVVEFHEIMRRHGKTPIEFLGAGRGARAERDPRPCDLSRPSFLAALADPQRPRPARRDRHDGRALPDRILAPRDHSRRCRRVSPRPGSISASAPTPFRTISSRRCVLPRSSRGSPRRTPIR
jgi:cytosine/adenosine deaminase-related metal-dependent hydrolase